MSALTGSIQHSTGNPSQSNQARKRNKSYQTRKGKNKIVSVYMACYYILKKNLKSTPKNLFQLINNSVKLQDKK